MKKYRSFNEEIGIQIENSKLNSDNFILKIKLTELYPRSNCQSYILYCKLCCHSVAHQLVGAYYIIIYTYGAIICLPFTT